MRDDYIAKRISVGVAVDRFCNLVELRSEVSASPDALARADHILSWYLDHSRGEIARLVEVERRSEAGPPAGWVDPSTPAPSEVEEAAAEIRRLRTAEAPLLDELVRVAIVENDRAVRQALEGKRDPHTGALWETCFRTAFERVLNRERAPFDHRAVGAGGGDEDTVQCPSMHGQLMCVFVDGHDGHHMGGSETWESHDASAATVDAATSDAPATAGRGDSSASPSGSSTSAHAPIAGGGRRIESETTASAKSVSPAIPPAPSGPNASAARETVVWADEATPFTGPQVKALLDENERLRKPPQLVRYAVWRHREANTPELVAAFRHRDHAEQWAQKMYASSEREVTRLDDDASPAATPTPSAAERDEGKYFEKARVYGAIAYRFRAALQLIAQGVGVTASHVAARDALKWRYSSEFGGVPQADLDAFEATLVPATTPSSGKTWDDALDACIAIVRGGALHYAAGIIERIEKLRSDQFTRKADT